MNKNLIQKLKTLVKKEGFYIVLFLCLCIILAAGTYSYKKFVSQNEITKTEDTNNEVSYNNVDDNTSVIKNEIPNAERVENNSTAQNNDQDKNNVDKEKTTTVSTSNKVDFVTPLNGTESRNYTYPKPVKIGENTFRTIKGINLSAKIGTSVKAAADGVVDLVENTGVEEGMVVEIKHANGLKTRYGNLDPKVNVKKGEKVTAKTVIGKVGETAKVFSKDTFGEFLNLQVIDANGEQVNPEKYFKLSSK